MRPTSHSKDVFTTTFQERLTSLLEDGYVVRVKCEDKRLMFVRLKHMGNGNTIILKGYPHERLITQYTNNVKVYEQTF